MANSKPHCSVSYHRLGGSELETFSHGVLTGIYDHSDVFTTPPLTKAAYEAVIEVFHASYEAYKNGGKSQKGAYLSSKTDLMSALDTIAEYVDEMPGVDEDMIVLAGFEPTKTGETKKVVPGAPAVESIEQGPRGTLEVTCNVSAGAEYYGCVVLTKPLVDNYVLLSDGSIFIKEKEVVERMVLTKSRKKIITNLEPKTEYWFYFFAANSAGVSQLGEGMSRVCL